VLIGGAELGKHFRRLIAFIVALSFCSVLQLSALDAPFSGCDDKAASETVEKDVESPQIGAEKEAVNPIIKKKRSALPWILGGLGLAALIISLIVSKHNKYDIRGKWALRIHTKIEVNWICSFFGGINNGTFSVLVNDEVVEKGEYQTDGKSVNFQFVGRAEDRRNFSGEFTNKNEMKGGMAVYNPAYIGTWDASRL